MEFRLRSQSLLKGDFGFGEVKGGVSRRWNSRDSGFEMTHYKLKILFFLSPGHKDAGAVQAAKGIMSIQTFLGPGYSKLADLCLL